MGDVDNDTHASAPEPAGPEAVAARPSKPPSRSSEPVWDRIKRHKVVEWTLAYVAFGYALLHGVQMLRETFEWPLLVPRLTVVALVLGAPIAVTLAWYHGHRARHRVSGQELSILIALLVVAGSVLWFVSRHERTAAAAVSGAASSAVRETAFNPPPHSIAVLPFVNMSGDKDQEYFSDGLSEELLNSLARINELQVAARTSSFYFKGKDADLATIAHKLNVASVLEGSVRRSGHTIRVTAQLNSAITGFHLWSQTYDRDLSDVLKLQTDIANAVASALKVTLLGKIAEKIEVGGTRNPAAFDAYLRASKAYLAAHDAQAVQAAISGYTEAISLDPQYALAFADRSLALHKLAGYFTKLVAIPETYEKARLDGQHSLVLAPALPQGHLALAVYFESAVLDFTQASTEYERAMALGSGNARVLTNYGGFAVAMGRTEAGLAAARRAVALDPLNPGTHGGLAYALYIARSYKESVAAYLDQLVLDPTAPRAFLGLPYYILADFQQARATCEFKDQGWPTQWCLALTYEKLGRHADAEAQVAKMKASTGDAEAYQYVTIYAQWGDTFKALEWLETALRLRDSGLEYLRTDPLLDPLRNEARFQAIERALKFPN
jgi:TolB-like protein